MKVILICGLSLLATGCVLKPDAANQTRRAMTDAGAPYAQLRDNRQIPDLPTSPTWQDALDRALHVNGDLEAAYFDWAMAVSKIDQAGSYPSQPVEIGFDYMLGGGRMKSWDRTTVRAGFMDATAWPTKTYQNAKVAWRDAQATGDRFIAAKFKLQRDLLVAWNQFALLGEQVRIQEQNVQLLQMVRDTATGRVRAGGPQQDLLRADLQLRLAEDRLASMRSQLRQQQARLNAILMRDGDAPLDNVKIVPRPVAVSDASLLAMGVNNNPELRALASQIDGRHDAIERAQMQYLPDFNPMAGFTGSVSQFVGAAIVLPTELPKIRAMIEESRADLRRVQAMRDQTHSNTAAEYVAAIVALRNAERQIDFFSITVVPLAEQTIDVSRQSYSSGTSGYLDLIDTQRTLLDVRLTLVEARAMREQQLAEIERLAGADLETIQITPTTQEMP